MKRTMTPVEARRILAKAPSRVAFWLCTNEMIYTIEQLASSLSRVDDDVFRYHVTRDKNDFERWIREIINDRELAREIARIKTRETLIRKINERIDELRKALKVKRQAKKKVSRKKIKKRKVKRGKKVKRKKPRAMKKATGKKRKTKKAKRKGKKKR